MWSFLLIAAFANEPAVSGTWVLADDEATVERAQKVALKAAVADMSFAYRPFAKPRLEPVVRNCDALWLQVDTELLEVRCDDGDALSVARGGPQPWTSDKGEPLTVEVDATAEAVFLSFTGEQGGQRSAYARDGAHLLLTKEITSAYLPTPVRWTVRYALSDKAGQGADAPASGAD